MADHAHVEHDKDSVSGERFQAARRGADDHRQVAASLDRGVFDAQSLLAVQRLAGNRTAASIIDDSEPSPVLNVLSRSGSPLEPTVRNEMEQRLGSDYSGVRIHTDAAAAASAQSVSADAYTSGNHVVFAPGRYAPTTEAGKHMLAHELVHTDQQRSGAVEATPVGGGIALSDPDDRFEREAEHAATQAMSSS